MTERERMMGMAYGNRGLADYGGLDVHHEGCLGHACHGCRECDPPEVRCENCQGPDGDHDSDCPNNTEG